MRHHFLTRIHTLSFLLLCGLLASCGASSIKEPFQPVRIVVMGDAFSDLTKTAQYTVNDDSINNWTSQIAASYGVSTLPLAKGNARISATTGAGGLPVMSLTEQVAGYAYQRGDLVVINAGFSDLIAEAAGANSKANAAEYGIAYAGLVRRLVQAGAQHIVVANVYDLAKTPGALILKNLATLTGERGALVVAFNDALKSSLGNATLGYVGDNVRLVDLEAYFNTVSTNPTSYSYSDATTVACTYKDPTDGIGIGAGQVNSKLCKIDNAAATYNSYMFADSIYPSPAFHRAWGASVYAQLIALW